jgi:hypothetical protein
MIDPPTPLFTEDTDNWQRDTMGNTMVLGQS